MKKYGNLSNYLDNDILGLMKVFFKYVKENSIKIYNEFNIQHELGIFMRFYFNDSEEYTIEFERNVSELGIIYNDKDNDKKKLESMGKEPEKLKHEMDIYITGKNKGYAIELKYPSIKKDKNGKYKPNGAFNEVMYECIKDIKFMEVLKNYGLKTYSITIVNSIADGFYNWKRANQGSQNIIYQYFRGYENGEKKQCKKIKANENIDYPINVNNKAILLHANYLVEWQYDWEDGKYYVIKYGGK